MGDAYNAGLNISPVFNQAQKADSQHRSEGVLSRLLRNFFPEKYYAAIGKTLDSIASQLRKTFPDLDDASLAVMAWDISMGAKRLTNTFNTMQIAEERICDTHTEQIDEGWLHPWIESTGYIYNPDLQKMWADMLVAEAHNPGDVPKRVMRALSELEPDEARCFVGLCRVSALNDSGQPMYPIILKINDSLYRDIGITQELLDNLKEMELLTFTDAGRFVFYNESRDFDLVLSDRTHKLKLPRGLISTAPGLLEGPWLATGFLSFTLLGSALANTCDFITESGLADYLQSTWDKIDKYTENFINATETPTFSSYRSDMCMQGEADYCVWDEYPGI